MNCLFVHIPKNAGRAIETALLSEVGGPDGGRRTLPNRAAAWLARATQPSFAKTHLIGTLDVTLAAQHLTYVEMEMLGLLPARPDAVSFCVVRNPYDRALSSVMHFSAAPWADAEEESVRKRGFERDLEIWLDGPLSDHNHRAHHRPQMDFLRDKRGEIAVDHILRFERLQQDFAYMAARLGRADGGFAKVGASGRRRNYLDFYTPRSRQLVEEAYGDDIEELRYAFSTIGGGNL